MTMNDNFTIDKSKLIRRAIIEMSYYAKAGHIPSALSMADYLGVYFCNFFTKNTYILLGKPYGAQAYYAAFWLRGLIEPRWREYGYSNPNWTYCMSRENQFIHFIDDTMGNALPVGCGVAMSTDRQVYVNISDAAFQQGTVWEAIMFAGHHSLENLLVTIDYNKMQVLGRTPEILDLEPLPQKLSAFNWEVFNCDGHEIEAIHETYKKCLLTKSKKPKIIIFNTVKGHGVSFMENNMDWHYKTLSEDTYNKAMDELT